MSDELTPREKELLAKLPRERVPLGLEGRVVEAMREKGFLTKRRRTVTITNSRVAGLLAACVALMIGAYAIGLHRGGGEALLTVVPMERDARVGGPGDDLDLEVKKTPAPGNVAERDRTDQTSPAREVGREERPAPEKPNASVPVESGDKAPKQQNMAKSKAEGVVEPAPEVVARTVEKTTSDTRQLEEQPRSAGGKEGPATPSTETSTKRPDQGSEESKRLDDTRGWADAQPAGEARPSARAQSNRALTTVSRDATREADAESVAKKDLPLPQSIRDDLADRRLTLLLNGTRVTVEADSARVVEDQRGRILIVYTPDGIIRLRLAD